MSLPSWPNEIRAESPRSLGYFFNLSIKVIVSFTCGERSRAIDLQISLSLSPAIVPNLPHGAPQHLFGEITKVLPIALQSDESSLPSERLGKMLIAIIIVPEVAGGHHLAEQEKPQLIICLAE